MTLDVFYVVSFVAGVAAVEIWTWIARRRARRRPSHFAPGERLDQLRRLQRGRRL